MLKGRAKRRKIHRDDQRFHDRYRELDAARPIGYTGLRVPDTFELGQITTDIHDAGIAAADIAYDLRTIDYAVSEGLLQFAMSGEEAARLLLLAADIEFQVQEVLEYAEEIKTYVDFLYTEQQVFRGMNTAQTDLTATRLSALRRPGADATVGA